nr:hypothetical protein [Porphyrobacter sp. AAP82]
MPQLLVGLAADTGEEVGGVLIAGGGRCVAIGAHQLAEFAQRSGERLKVRLAPARRERIFLEAARRRHGLDPSVGNAAQRGDAFGNGVGEVCADGRHGVERFVKLHEILAAHVPVCLFQLHREIDRIDKARL